MFQFEHLDDVQSTLQRLIERDPPLVKMLPRQPGTKESRYAHLLSGDVEVSNLEPSRAMPSVNSENQRLTRLEEEMAALRSELDAIRQQLAEFRKQFE
jgi:hypothetical protein